MLTRPVKFLNDYIKTHFEEGYFTHCYTTAISSGGESFCRTHDGVGFLFFAPWLCPVNGKPWCMETWIRVPPFIGNEWRQLSRRHCMWSFSDDYRSGLSPDVRVRVHLYHTNGRSVLAYVQEGEPDILYKVSMINGGALTADGEALLKRRISTLWDCKMI